MKNCEFLLITLLIFLLNTPKIKAENPFKMNTENDNAVMLLSVFHFANPSLDVIKTDVIDVTSKESQIYLQKLSSKISELKPTVVMLEFDPENTETMNKEYQQYLKDQFELPVNEVYQIGFRVAKLSGLKEIHSLDERSVGWDSKPLFDYMKVKDKATNQKMNTIIKTLTRSMDDDQKRLSLKQLIQKNNDPANEQLNKSFYMFTNAVGANDGFAGADATASWWHRNFRIYAKIQQHALKGNRVFALAGQGHTAILRDLLDDDAQIEAINPSEYLNNN